MEVGGPRLLKVHPYIQMIFTRNFLPLVLVNCSSVVGVETHEAGHHKLPLR